MKLLINYTEIPIALTEKERHKKNRTLPTETKPRPHKAKKLNQMRWQWDSKIVVTSTYNWWIRSSSLLSNLLKPRQHHSSIWKEDSPAVPRFQWETDFSGLVSFFARSDSWMIDFILYIKFGWQNIHYHTTSNSCLSMRTNIMVYEFGFNILINYILIWNSMIWFSLIMFFWKKNNYNYFKRKFIVFLLLNFLFSINF